MKKPPAPGPILRPLVLNYLYGGVVHYRAGDALAPRILPDYDLVLIIEGQVTYRIGNVNHSAPPGTIILARPGFLESYIWDPQSRTRHAYIHFDIDQMPENWTSLDQWPVVNKNVDPVVPAIFRHLIGRIAGHPEWPTEIPGPDECRLMECLISILLEPADEKRSSISPRLPEPVHQALNLMRDIIDKVPYQVVDLGQVASRAGVTKKHLCRLFQNALGHSPMKTFQLLKLQLALALLGRSNLAIKEIADRCGFENALYFSRCFTKAYGASPTKIRQSLLRKEAPPTNGLPPEITPRIYW